MDWCWGWNSNTLATSCEKLTHWKRLWCWEGLGARGEGDDRGWDGWMASPTRWTWVWVNSGSWWWTERPGVLQFIGSQRVGHNWATELNWTEGIWGLGLNQDGFVLTRCQKQDLNPALLRKTWFPNVQCSLINCYSGPSPTIYPMYVKLKALWKRKLISLFTLKPRL